MTYNILIRCDISQITIFENYTSTETAASGLDPDLDFGPHLEALNMGIHEDPQCKGFPIAHITFYFSDAHLLSLLSIEPLSHEYTLDSCAN
jgi:hypothetical protein